jgi:restriction endonuclease Mrr
LMQETFDSSRTEMLQLTLSGFLQAVSAQYPERVSRATVDEVRESEAVAGEIAGVDGKATSRVDREMDAIEFNEAESGDSIHLLGMTPRDLEHLIGRLFEAMGYTVTITPTVRDPGYDVDASRVDPVRGPIRKIVQVKGYRHVVGVEAIYSLFGVMVHESATAGVLVTTSRFSRSAREFAEGKDIELIEGAELVDLIRTHLGFEASVTSGRIHPET